MQLDARVSADPTLTRNSTMIVTSNASPLDSPLHSSQLIKGSTLMAIIAANRMGLKIEAAYFIPNTIIKRHAPPIRR